MRILTLAFITLHIVLRAQVSTFSFNISGTPPAGMASALTVAGQKWSQHLNITVPVKVNVSTVNSNLLPFSAITFANARQNFTNAPIANVLYPTALANQIAGFETNAGEYDMDIVFNLNTNYYYGNGKPPANQMDFITTAMHEIGHGLGFYSAGNVDQNNGEGSFGNVPAFFITSFPWQGQAGLPSVYDKFIIRFSNNYLVGCAPQNSQALGDSLKNGPMYFNGPLYANPSHSNTPVRLSAGSGAFTLGVHLLHIHESYANTIMSYYWGNGDTVRVPAVWEMGILKEIGWNMTNPGIKENSPLSIAAAWPSPANEKVFIRATGMSEIKVFDFQGMLVKQLNNSRKEEEFEIETGDLKEGIYFFTVAFSDSRKSVSKKVLVRH